MTDEMLNNIPEEEDNIVELTDDDGVVSKFEYLATVPYDGDEYVALLVLDEDGNEPKGDDALTPEARMENARAEIKSLLGKK